jgi:hypothetical protein
MHTLTFKTKLDSNIIELLNVADFIGKEVVISIIEWTEESPKKKSKNWKYVGAVKLGKQLDSKNIRDLAYE